MLAFALSIPLTEHLHLQAHREEIEQRQQSSSALGSLARKAAAPVGWMLSGVLVTLAHSSVSRRRKAGRVTRLSAS